MAVSFVQLLGSNQDKTAGLAITVTIGSPPTALVGDDVFMAYAGDDIGSAFVGSDGGTATIVWTMEKEEIFTGNVKTQLWRGAVTAGGTITSCSVSWTTNVTAKALVAGLFRGVGTQDGTMGVQSAGGSALLIGSTLAWQTGDLGIGAAGFEGPNSDVHAPSGNLGTPTEVGQNGTTGGGAATNITATLTFGIATADGTTGSDSLSSGNNDLRDFSSASGVYSPSAPVEPRGARSTVDVYNPAQARAILRSRGR